MMRLSLSLAFAASFLPEICGATWRDDISHVIIFGDSYTDQSRAHSISNGTYPGRYYKTIYPPEDASADGRVSWPWYFGLYTDLPYENYAVGGAVCSNDLTPGFGVPAVSGGQLDWFVQDHVLANSSCRRPAKMDIIGEETLAILWIGTNDLGIHSLLAPNSTEDQTYWPDEPPMTPQVPPVAPGNDNATTLLDLADCQLGTFSSLYDYGVRNFLLLSTIPLHLTTLYSTRDDPVIYWPEPHDGHSWHRQMFHYANSLNAFLQVGVEKAHAAFKGDARIDFFNTYRFLEELYLHPEQYYNGSAPANVTGHCHQCPNATDWHYCGIGDCSMDERDSYMFWDELHPSEQSGRLLANELVKKLDGQSVY